MLWYTLRHYMKLGCRLAIMCYNNDVKVPNLGIALLLDAATVTRSILGNPWCMCFFLVFYHYFKLQALSNEHLNMIPHSCINHSDNLQLNFVRSFFSNVDNIVPMCDAQIHNISFKERETERDRERKRSTNSLTKIFYDIYVCKTKKIRYIWIFQKQPMDILDTFGKTRK